MLRFVSFLTLVATLALGAGIPLPATAQEAGEDGQEEGPVRPASFHELKELSPIRARRLSSSDEDWQNGNVDARSILRGETRLLGELEGPGVIQHLWFTVGTNDPFYARNLVLRIYWDGEERPSVEAPLGDFFAVGHALRRDVNSIPVSNSTFGKAYNCYWPMPFRESARLEIANESSDYDAAVYWNVDWGNLDEVAENTPYFHARYRQEFPAKGGDYLFLDTEGAGYYVGTVYSARLRSPGWFGEGDERLYIDGEELPSLRGTGTEDYFSQAWGFHQLHRPYYGGSIIEGWQPGELISVYRWHWLDPIPFAESLRMTIEHKNFDFDLKEGTISSRDRHDDLSSVAYWYQLGQEKAFAEFPDAADRLYEMVHVEWEDRQEEIQKPEDVKMTMKTSTQLSGTGYLVLEGLDKDEEVRLSFEIPAEDRYRPRLFLGKTEKSGVFSVSFGKDALLARIDLNSERELEPHEELLDWTALKEENQTVILRCLEKGDLVLDALQLVPESSLKAEGNP